MLLFSCYKKESQGHFIEMIAQNYYYIKHVHPDISVRGKKNFIGQAVSF